MDSKVTIYFEEPFWIGVFERHDEEGYSVAKVTFGKEPTEPELYEYIQDNYSELQFGKPTKESQTEEIQKNYKRIQRELKKDMARKGVSSKAHEAMRKIIEQNKSDNRKKTKEEIEEERKQKFAIRSEKKKEKHNGH